MATRLEELDRMKADFIAHVSHELRTPLTGIQEGTALLLEQIPGPLTTTQQQILGVVRNHSTRLARHITSILDLSKMEADMLEYVCVPSNPAMLLERGVEAVQFMAQKKRLHIEVLCTSPLPDLCLDEGRMQQVLDNLLSNAVKFTPQDGEITIRTFNDKQARFHFEITDTGIGIEPQRLASLFQPFEQADPSVTRQFGGLGLGLYIAKQIVDRHGGSIWVDSKEGVGTTFYFSLPIASVAAREPAQPPQYQQAAAP